MDNPDRNTGNIGLKIQNENQQNKKDITVLLTLQKYEWTYYGRFIIKNDSILNIIHSISNIREVIFRFMKQFGYFHK